MFWVLKRTVSMRRFFLSTQNIMLKQMDNEIFSISCEYMGVDAKKPVFGVGNQQRRRPACASAQSNQRHCFSLIGMYCIKTCYKWNFTILASICGWADWFESHFIRNLEDRFSRVRPILCLSGAMKFLLHFSSISAMAATYALYVWGENKSRELSRKNPADYINDE